MKTKGLFDTDKKAVAVIIITIHKNNFLVFTVFGRN